MRTSKPPESRYGRIPAERATQTSVGGEGGTLTPMGPQPFHPSELTQLPPVNRRYLPAVPMHGFELGGDETLAEGLQRIALEQFDLAISGFRGPESDIDTAVHEARKSTKRVRAVLRLVRGEIGNRVYRVENAALRDTARLIAPMRDGAVMVDSVRHLRDAFGHKLAPGVFQELEGALVDRHLQRRQRVLDDEAILPAVIAAFEAARSRYAAWPVDPGFPVPGSNARTAIRHGFGALEPGLAATYGRGRREMQAAMADPVSEHFHLWRKRVKYLRHQMEVLAPLWPEVVGGMAKSFDRLGEILGEEHDLAVLLQLVAGVPSMCPDPVERSLLAALAQHRRAELRVAAGALGTRLFAERPDQFVERMSAYWDAWDAPHPLGMGYPF
jgi:CHAD domain-containing protein